MAITLKTLGTRATLEKGVWQCEDESIVRILTSSGNSRPFTGYEPNPELADALYVAERFDGVIGSQTPMRPLPEGAIP